MYKEFDDFDQLKEFVFEDKNASGLDSSTAHRYPVRFVLFDNFKDSFRFVSHLQSIMKIPVESVDKWLDEDDEDGMITHSQLAERIKNYIQTHTSDIVIAPFSELARFYDNEDGHAEFRSLITTIRGIEASKSANKQRIYIPIVGLEGKMSTFIDDIQAYIWYYKSSEKESNYHLILTPSTYAVKNIEKEYTLIPTMKRWLKVWSESNVMNRIISTSAKMNALSNYARPDNAFTFCKCDNVYDFLTKGLQFDFGQIQYCNNEENYWEQLAAEINLNQRFSFDEFVTNYFGINNLSSTNNFLSAWFKNNRPFSRWLLIKYYYSRFCGINYICQAIEKNNGYTDRDFFTSIALSIFYMDDMESSRRERALCLRWAEMKGVSLSESVENKLARKLEKVAFENGYKTAISYFSPLTEIEKRLAIEWYADGKIILDDLKDFYPEFYHYLQNPAISNEASQQWVHPYIQDYKQAKVTNSYTEKIKDLIFKHNASPVLFNRWYQNFKTVRTILDNRHDIEVFFWIDGLGIDWIPLISWLLESKKDEGLYLNEILIAKALLPTTTEINKSELQILAGNNLYKEGNLDKYAHTSTKYPQFIIDEIKIVVDAIEKILSKYAGHKIAIISDHGLTALSQYCDGNKMGEIKTEHHGRAAMYIGNKKPVSNNDYIILEDKITLCALSHKSLGSKIPNGQSAHGGCTPEEVLVPIFIISSSANPKTWTAIIIDDEVTGTHPVVQFNIKGLQPSDIPTIIYNGKRYNLTKEKEDLFSSDRLDLVPHVKEVKLNIGQEEQIFPLQLMLGAQDNDDFDDLFS